MNPIIKRWVVVLAIVLIAGLIMSGVILAWHATASVPGVLNEALRRARAADSYQFNSDILQIRVPTSIVTNVGRQSSSDELHLEGQVNQRDKNMQMRMWIDQGSVADPTSGVAVKMEGGKTYVQEGLGAWREQAGLTDGFAPQGDFMGFLTALRDPAAHPPEETNGIRYVRYTFRLDSLALAAYIRDQLEAQMRQKGQLIGQMQLDLPASYLDMTGDGEIWIGEDGLPLRQVLRMQFPEQGDERTYAEITTNYSEFVEPAQAAAQFRLLAGLRRLASPAPVIIMLAVLAFWALLRTRPKLVWRVLIAVVIALMVLNPLLMDVRAAQAGRDFSAEAEAQEQQRAQAQQRETILASMSAPGRDAHTDPLAVMEQPVVALSEADGVHAAGILALGARELPAVAPLLADDGTDTDSDGLTNFQEESIGTDPEYADSDDDTLNDNIEVDGFVLPYDTQRWYLDPTSDDSNKDGISDGEEYDLDDDGIAEDTDDDGIPDVFDRDNDGDGVPDRKDLSPFALAPEPQWEEDPFSEDNPFRLTLNSLTAGEPTFVDLQLRPTNPQQLQYAYHVLDWPIDAKGAIQDIDSATYASIPRAPGSAPPTASDQNGDLKLVPMLEIRMPDGGANLPAPEDWDEALDPYGISINDYNLAGSTKVAYVPLSIVTDEDTGEKVAFGARMRYLPSGTWPAAHEVRLVWLVQALVDVPCDPLSDPECPADRYQHNVSRVVQSYYENWTLTGLNVKEDHGARVAVIYEDPDLAESINADVHQNGVLFAMSYGLEQGFLSARDGDGNGQRDLDVDEIYRRFNYPQQCTGEACWSIPNTLRVERYDYETIDQAVNDLTADKTAAILNDEPIDMAWRRDNSYKPLLMYAQESASRALGMDAMRAPDSPVTWDGSTMAVNFATPSRTVIASLKWIPYCGVREGDAIAWSVCAMEAWWTYLEYHNFPAPDPADPTEFDGEKMEMDLYALSLAQGTSRIIELDMQIIPPPVIVDTDLEINEIIETIVYFGSEKLSDKVKDIVNDRFMGAFDEVSTWQKFKNWCSDLKSGKLWASLKTKIGATSWTQRIGFGLLAVGAVVAIGVSADYLFKGNAVPAKITALALAGALTIYEAIKPIKAFVDIYKCIGFTKDLLRWRSEMVGSCKRAGVIGAIIAGVATWALFIVQVCTNDAPIFGLAFNQALAQAIAETIYIIIMTALAASIVGTIIVAIIALIDIIITIICTAVGAEESGWCKGISGWITTAIAWTMYSNSPMIDLEKENLVVPDSPSLALAQQNKGYVAGNTVNLSMDVATNIVHRSPPWYDWVKMWPYTWMYSRYNLTTSSFQYSLTDNEQEPGAWRGQMTGAWLEVQVDHTSAGVNMWRARAASTATTPNGLSLEAGINQPLPFYFNMSYAVPAYECWGVFFLNYCHVQDLGDHSSQKIEDLVLDVLPASLDGFMALREVEPIQPDPQDKSWALAWDNRFPPLADADGDGLLQTGLDPDDSSFDTDHDGLSDAFELEQREKGKAYSPTDCDTDDDHLSDLQEALLGTDPASADTDRDGLEDGVEVIHLEMDSETCTLRSTLAGGWLLTIPSAVVGDRQVMVQSNPLAPDSDSDSVSDAVERQYASLGTLDPHGYPYHPQVYNTPWVGVYGSLSSGMIRPGDSVAYTTTVETYTPLDDSPLFVAADEQSGAWSISQQFTLDFNPSAPSLPETAVEAITLNLPPGIPSQTIPITSGFTANYSPPNPSLPNPFVVNTNLIIDSVSPLSSIDSLADGQYIKGEAGGTTVTIIGGSAWDDVEAGFAGTGISKVEVQVNHGDWQEAFGTNAWIFALVGEGEGPYTICTRATDGAGNVETSPSCIQVLGDAQPPEAAFSGNGLAAIPDRLGDGVWAVELAGTAWDDVIQDRLDPALTYPGSGVDLGGFQVRLRRNSETNPEAGAWQKTTMTPVGDDTYTWEVWYHFPATLADATGEWVPEMRAVDMAGNFVPAGRIPGSLVVLDGNEPLAEMNQQDAERQALTGAAPLSGTTRDETGVEKLELAFRPVNALNPLKDAVLWLPFDEPANQYYWSDRSGHGHFASCDPEEQVCPHTGVPGRSDGGLAVSETYTTAVVSDAPELNIAADSGFSVQVWINTSLAQATILSKQGAYNIGIYEVAWPEFAVGGNQVDNMDLELNDNRWHQIVGTLDRSSSQIHLYVDGVLSGTAGIPAGEAYTSTAPLEIHNYDGAVDEVAIFNRTLSAEEVQALYQAVDRVWYPAALVSHGPGVLQTEWTLPLPPNLEGVYEVDLRTWDVLGNHDIQLNFWRGVIDSTAPRLTLTAYQPGMPSYRPDPTKPDWLTAVHYNCTAQDMFLDEATYQCPGRSLPPPRLTFVDDPVLLDLFPSLALVSELSLAWTQWQPTGLSPASMRACDRWGNCADKTISLDLHPLTHEGPIAVIVSPLDGAVIDGNNVNVTIHAFSDNEVEDAWLQKVVLSLDGVNVHTQNFPPDTVSDTSYQVTVPVTAGPHTLFVYAVEWSGLIQSMSVDAVDITVDANPPRVAIGNDIITEADRYQKGSSALIFRGTAADTVCLSSVKLSVNGGPFESAVYHPALGTWEIAYYVNAPEGKLLTAQARATDCGGLTTAVTKQIPTDLTLPPALAPDTTIDAWPPNPGYPDNATFIFTGLKHENEIAVLMCQLDDGIYEPCASPFTYTAISLGLHTFRVRAVDDQGNVDPTPSSYTWMVVTEPLRTWMPLITQSRPALP